MNFTPKTEGQHTGEFIVSEANHTLSREVGVIKSGTVLVDGQLVELDDGKLVAKTADVTTEGDFDVPIEGIVLGNWDATGGDIPEVPYIKRLAEVNEGELTFPSAGTKALAIEALANQSPAQGASFIRVRPN